MRIHAVLGAVFGPASGLAWGLSIVILVIFIRLLLVPLFVKQVHAQRKMAQHAPHLQELRKKYKNDKQRLNEETMKFYKENGVNPLAGCLPMIPQMIVFFAVVSAATTFMTVRQSAKRGLMQTNVDPDNPMAQSQKYMMYIVPFFSLTGLYWQYGLVLYWVTTNLWTLGQQFFMFRNWTTDQPADAEGALDGATTGGTVRATQSSLRPGSARPGSGGSGAKAASGGARTGTASGGARTGTASGRTGSSGSSGSSGSGAARVKGGTGSASGGTGNGSGGARTGTASRPATGPNGAEKRGLLRLGRSKPEPEPEPEVPAAKVVRQQPVRQARSKRSGKR